MSKFDPPIGGTAVILEVYFPDLPCEWQTSVGTMHLIDLREWEVEVVAKALGEKLRTQWRILHEDADKRTARKAKAKDARISGMDEQSKARIGIDDRVMDMIRDAEKWQVEHTGRSMRIRAERVGSNDPCIASVEGVSDEVMAAE